MVANLFGAYRKVIHVLLQTKSMFIFNGLKCINAGGESKDK